MDSYDVLLRDVFSTTAMTVYCVQYSLPTQMPPGMRGSLLKTVACYNRLLILRVVFTVHSLSSACRVAFLTNIRYRYRY